MSAKDDVLDLEAIRERHEADGPMMPEWPSSPEACAAHRDRAALIAEVERLRTPSVGLEAPRAAYVEGYSEGHHDGIGCGHDLSPRCNHNAEDEWKGSQSERAALRGAQQAGTRLEGWALDLGDGVGFAFNASDGIPAPREVPATLILHTSTETTDGR